MYIRISKYHLFSFRSNKQEPILMHMFYYSCLFSVLEAQVVEMSTESKKKPADRYIWFSVRVIPLLTSLFILNKLILNIYAGRK